MKNKKKSSNAGMIKYALILFMPLFAAWLFVSNLQAQDEKPQFPGGEAELKKYLSANIKYPAEAQKQELQGTVKCRFLIDTAGKITEVSVVQSVSPEIDEEAIRIVSVMPKWIPAKEDGEAIEVYYTLPIQFILPEDNNASQNLIIKGVTIPEDVVIMLNGKIVPREELNKISPDKFESVSVLNDYYTSEFGGKDVYIITSK